MTGLVTLNHLVNLYAAANNPLITAAESEQTAITDTNAICLSVAFLTRYPCAMPFD